VRECPPWLLGKVLASVRRQRAEMPVPGLGRRAEVTATRHARTQALLADVARRRAEIQALIAEGRGAELEVLLARAIFHRPGQFEAIFGDRFREGEE